MESLDEILRRPVTQTTSAQRAAVLLGGGETVSFEAVTLADLIYDRVSIDPAALEAFDFVHPASTGDVYSLAVWSDDILSKPAASLDGSINRLQGYVFEQLAAISLRERGSIVEMPEGPTQPGWDFLVNGEPIQAKCGLSPELVTEHFARYPEIPRVVVNEELASYFADYDNVTPIYGVTRDLVRDTTVNSLDSAGDMLDLHLASVVPAITIIRNSYHCIRGDTDISGLASNLAADAASRYAAASATKMLGVGAVVLLGLTGWPAVLLPVFTASAGYRLGRGLSNAIKREVFLRNEQAALADGLRLWCGGCTRVLSRMIALAEKKRMRFGAVRERAHPDYRSMIDDWLHRLGAEQEFRKLHLRRFERGRESASEFDDRSDQLNACAAAMLAASRCGILPADLPAERQSLTVAASAYASGLRRRLLRR